jgi:hypothetical protein
MGKCFIFFLDYAVSRRKGQYSSVGCKAVVGFCVFAFAIIVGHSRLFVGVHSLNQVWYGW